MDHASLTIFRAIARSGSVVGAAQAVHSVPSNVSARLRKLEDAVGARLFVRQARGMALTPAGEVLLDYADRILALSDEARAAVAEMAGGGGQLRLGAMESAAAVRLPPLLADFADSHPRLRLSLQAGTSAAIIGAVLQRQIDLGLVAGPVDHPRLLGHPVFVEELVLLTGAGRINAAAATILVLRNGCAYRARAEAWARQAGMGPAAMMEFGTLDGLLGCVAAGMGVTVLPRSVAEQPGWRDRVCAAPLVDGRAETWAIWHADCAASAAMSAFLALLGRPDG